MKVVALLGSPRKKGNSTSYARHFLAQAESAGAQTHEFMLNGLTIRGCQSCYTCKTKSETCVVKDDMGEVLAQAAQADTLVLASPIYYYDISAQLKMFIDRTFSYLRSDYSSRLEPGKKLLLILTQESASEDYCADVFRRYEDIFKNYYQFSQAQMVPVLGIGIKDDPAERDDVIQKLNEAAKQMLSL